MFLKNRCTEFTILLAMVCVTYSSTILSGTNMSLVVQPNCVKYRVVCGTVYGDMHYKDLIGIFHPDPAFLSSLPWS